MEELFHKYETGTIKPDELVKLEALLSEKFSGQNPDGYSEYIQTLKNQRTHIKVEAIVEQSIANDLINRIEKDHPTDADMLELDTLLEQQEKDINGSSYGIYNTLMKGLTFDKNAQEIVQQTSNDLNKQNLVSEEANIESIDESNVESLLKDQRIEIAQVKEYQSYMQAMKAARTQLSVDEIIHNEINISESDLDQYEKGKTNAEENKAIEKFLEKDEVSDIDEYADYKTIMKVQKTSIDPTSISVEKGAKIIPMRRKIIRIASAAVAIFIIGFTGIMLSNVEQKQDVLAMVDGREITDPEEALAFTLAALGQTGKNFQAGTNEVNKIKRLNRTNIYK